MPARKKGVYLKEVEIKYKNRKVNNKKYSSKQVNNSKIIFELFSDLQNDTKEKFITINLDTKNKILCFEVVAIGNVENIFIRPMEVFRTSIMVNAHKAIIVHNHPSGDSEPSEDDITLTKKLKKLADDMGLHLLDHIIIGEDNYYSFSDSKLL